MKRYISYNNLIKEFEILDSQCYDIVQSVPFILNHFDSTGNLFKESLDDYQYHIFFQNDYKENEIFQVLEASINERIGWIFPIYSISSNSHDYSNNPHFCRYAFIAQQCLLQHEVTDIQDHETTIKKLINKGGIIFVYKNDLISKLSNFSIDHYLASFYKHGYYIDTKNKNTTINSSVNGKIKIQKVSNELINNEFIKDLYNRHIFEKNALVKFHSLYQVIEVIIDVLFIKNLKQYIEELEKKQSFIRSLRDRISKIESEKDRIKKATFIVNNDTSSKELHSLCNSFLQKMCRNEENFPESIYSVRNFIVHDFRYIINDLDSINSINEVFELFISELVIKYN